MPAVVIGFSVVLPNDLHRIISAYCAPSGDVRFLLNMPITLQTYKNDSRKSDHDRNTSKDEVKEIGKRVREGIGERVGEGISERVGVVEKSEVDTEDSKEEVGNKYRWNDNEEKMGRDLVLQRLVCILGREVEKRRRGQAYAAVKPTGAIPPEYRNGADEHIECHNKVHYMKSGVEFPIDAR